MAKYELFSGSLRAPIRTVEGEQMVPRDGEFVDSVVGTGRERDVVGTFRLDKGQTVREIKEVSAARR